MIGFSKTGSEIFKMVLYVTLPVWSVWYFNKDSFRDNINFPILKKFLTEEEYKELLKVADVKD